MKIEYEGPAFPVPPGCADKTTYTPMGTFGLSLRDYLAAAALQGILAYRDSSGSHADFAKCAYNHADAMIAERNRPK